LGNTVKNIRNQGTFSDHVDDLNALGFIWNPVPEYSDSIFRSGSRDEKWQRVYTALQYYMNKYRDIDVPRYFSVPSSEQWPSEIWGMNIGSTVSNIRSNNCFKDHKDELNAMGFEWRPQEKRWECINLALQTYKRIHGDLNVPQSFVVPNDSKWPSKIWGLKLGSIIDGIRNAGAFENYKDELNALGFEWKPKERHWEGVFLALQTYKRIHGDLNVPLSFVVPNDSKWPSEIWGLELGSTVNGIRYKENFENYKDELNALGFEWKPKERHWECVYLALRTYKLIFGHLNIPISFIVPDDDSQWPSETWGISLGRTAYQIRLRGYFKDHKDDLDSIGFV
jgi:hypothetical protein